MVRKKRTEVTIHTKRRLVIRADQPPVRSWCQGCGDLVPTLTAEAAAAVVGVTRRSIYALVEANRLHFTETPAGVLLICMNSLPK